MDKAEINSRHKQSTLDLKWAYLKRNMERQKLRQLEIHGRKPKP